MTRVQRTTDADPFRKKASAMRPVSTWLFICAFAVLLMALVGAVTRLTESGLSIVEWKPVTGALPPLNDADWQKEFDTYKTSPQYKKVNAGMDLPAFKKIFFWEWLHRFWGRFIGVLYALPLLYFWRRLPPSSRPAFLGILVLGAAQGGMGWLMVKSGLVDAPQVSHYRLAAHLMLAFLIFGCLFRLGLAFRLEPSKDAGKIAHFRGLIRGALALAGIVMTWGAFTAGLDAGMVYNDTFPLMGRTIYPTEMLQYKPVYRAFFEEPATVQFTHRVLAILLLLKILLIVNKTRGFNVPDRLAKLFRALWVVALLQIALGISTILTHVNIIVATAHQAGAVTIMAILVWLLHEIPIIKHDKEG
ncbi:MAG: COX15/CtaA family protein [Alphaproteobacteria bacterium]